MAHIHLIGEQGGVGPSLVARLEQRLSYVLVQYQRVNP
jgi:hypothetical protein